MVNARTEARVYAAHRAMAEALEEAPRDTLERARLRVRVALGMYDEAPDDPSQALRDLLTDVAHECAARGVDLDDAVAQAVWMRDEERKDWGVS